MPPTPRKRRERTLGLSLPDHIADLVHKHADAAHQSVSRYLRLAIADRVADETDDPRLAIVTDPTGAQHLRIPSGRSDETVYRTNREGFLAFLTGSPVVHLEPIDPE